MDVKPRVVVCEDEQTITLKVTGVINAEFAWPAIPNEQNKSVRIDLSRVDFINSVGVRNWIHTYPFKSKKVDLIDVSVHVMDSFNMTPGMQLGGKVLSFFLPVYCENCEETFELIKVSDINLNDPEVKIILKPCVCGSQPQLDTDVDSYLTCLGLSA
ncbi:MAG: hypothetical protein H7318_16920 [Oligoflexus sp.]|nr:hypothetical protein [Oligoflexus sp.]